MEGQALARWQCLVGLAQVMAVSAVPAAQLMSVRTGWPAKAAGDGLLTYSNTEEVKELTAAYGLAYKSTATKSTHSSPMKELLIGHNLDLALGPY